jgi:hypothetical protein
MTKKSTPLWRTMLEASDRECKAMSFDIPPEADQKIMASHLEAMLDIELCGCRLPRFWQDAFRGEAARARRGE